jgi:hypothetical protein
MSGSGFQLSLLRDGRLAPLATSGVAGLAVEPDGTRIVWANATGAAVFRATPRQIGARRFARGEPAADQIARIAASLSPGAAPRLERLRGFGAGIGRALTCACSHIVLADTPQPFSWSRSNAAGPTCRSASASPACSPAARNRSPPLRRRTAHCRHRRRHARLDGATSLAAIGAGALGRRALAAGMPWRRRHQSPSTASAARPRRC